MHTTILTKNRLPVAFIQSEEPLIYDVFSALDLLATIEYQYEVERIALSKTVMTESFFQLQTGLAGEILQKFVTYQMKLAIVGDFSDYKSKALQDFIYESNKGNHIFFVPDMETALEKLTIN